MLSLKFAKYLEVPRTRRISSRSKYDFAEKPFKNATKIHEWWCITDNPENFTARFYQSLYQVNRFGIKKFGRQDNKKKKSRK